MEDQAEIITSVQNALVKAMRSLASKKGRENTGWFLSEGIKMLDEALRSDAPIEAVIIEGDARGSSVDGFDAGLQKRLAEKKIRTAYVTRAVMEAVCDTRTPQGIAAAIRLPRNGSGELMLSGDLPERLIVLCGVQDPGNVGTVWRTAEAAGFGGLVLSPDCADPFGPKVLRGTMGAVFRLPVAVRRVEDVLAELSRRGFTHYAASLSEDSADVMTACPKFSSPLTLLIGGEARGIPRTVLDLCDSNIFIPMRGGTESLNAAIAAGILMYKIAYA